MVEPKLPKEEVKKESKKEESKPKEVGPTGGKEPPTQPPAQPHPTPLSQMSEQEQIYWTWVIRNKMLHVTDIATFKIADGVVLVAVDALGRPIIDSSLYLDGHVLDQLAETLRKFAQEENEEEIEGGEESEEEAEEESEEDEEGEE
ncbi:MAG: hypothetical protein ACP5HJ_01245 [Candidatus Micrarchaeia archaeon]